MRTVHNLVVEVKTIEGRVLSRETVEVKNPDHLVHHMRRYGRDILRRLESGLQKVERLPTENMQINEKGRKALISAGILSLADLMKHTETSLRAIKGVGPQTLDDIRFLLSARGLYLEIGV